MMVRLRRWSRAAGLLLAAALLSSSVLAQDVYVTSTNNAISKVDFSGAGSVTTVVTASGGTNFQGLAVGEEGGLHFIVANGTGGGNVLQFVPQPGAQAGEPIASLANAAGVALDANENLYAVNGTFGGPDQLILVPKTPTGYGTSVTTISVLGVDELTDVKVAKFDAPGLELQRGDVLVLARKPAKLIRYRGAAATTLIGTGSSPSRSFPVNTEPTGLAFAPNGNVIVTTWGGSVLVWEGGSSLSTSVASLPGNGLRVAVDLFAKLMYVTFQNGGGVVRYQIDAAGFANASTAKLVTISLSSPVGVSVEGDKDAAPFLAGSDVRVSLPAVTAAFEQIDTGGAGKLECISFTDPRESRSSCQASSPSGPLKCALSLTDSDLPSAITSRDLPNVVPKFVRGFPLNGDGPPTLRLCVAETNALYNGLVDLVSDEHSWLGQDPDCHAADRTMRPRFFWGEDPPGPDLIEGGRVFINANAKCNRDEGNSSKFGSLFLPASRDTRAIDGPKKVGRSGNCTESDGILDCQLNKLQALLDSLSCIDRSTSNGLKTMLRGVIGEFDRGDYCGAKTDLLAFRCAIDEALTTAFGACESATSTATAWEELRARSNAALFELCQPELGAETCSPVCTNNQEGGTLLACPGP